MKSLNVNPAIQKCSGIFTPEILKWIEDEGFEIHKNDSYCDKATNDPYEDNCFYKRMFVGGFSLGIYIFSWGIGVDVDYDCGGNSCVRVWKFEFFSFEEAYDEVVDFVNGYRS
jgi:hypothetical protein